MTHLERLAKGIPVTLPEDADGYTGRECPAQECEGYFKIVFEDDVSDEIQCYCPYCGHTASHEEFHTQEQIKFMESVAIREVTKAVTKDLKQSEFEIKPKGSFGIGMKLEVESGPLPLIHRYREKALETHIQCNNCSLKYAVYGVFGFCPDCGEHNSQQTLDMNLELVAKMLDMVEIVEGEVGERIIENALEDCVSSFDGYGRELCRVCSSRATNPEKVVKVSFQNLDKAQNAVKKLFDKDLKAGLTQGEWGAAMIGFQKRHLFTHKMGVIDDDYIQKTGDTKAIVGRKITITESEVRELVKIIDKLAQYFSKEMGATP